MDEAHRRFKPRITVTRNAPRAANRYQNAIVVSVIVSEKGRGADGDLMAWRSVDGGKTWGEGRRVNDVAGSAREGLHAMAAGGEAILFATWLDLRSEGTKVFGAVSRDGGVTWAENRPVYESPSGSVRECCHPTAYVDERGRMFVMFRNWLLETVTCTLFDPTTVAARLVLLGN